MEPETNVSFYQSLREVQGDVISDLKRDRGKALNAGQAPKSGHAISR